MWDNYNMLAMIFAHVSATVRSSTLPSFMEPNVGEYSLNTLVAILARFDTSHGCTISLCSRCLSFTRGFNVDFRDFASNQ